jgi:hypothetical protein
MAATVVIAMTALVNFVETGDRGMASAKRRLGLVAAVVVAAVAFAATPASASGYGSDTGCPSPRPGVDALQAKGVYAVARPPLELIHRSSSTEGSAESSG